MACQFTSVTAVPGVKLMYISWKAKIYIYTYSTENPNKYLVPKGKFQLIVEDFVGE